MLLGIPFIYFSVLNALCARTQNLLLFKESLKNYFTDTFTITV